MNQIIGNEFKISNKISTVQIIQKIIHLFIQKVRMTRQSAIYTIPRILTSVNDLLLKFTT